MTPDLSRDAIARTRNRIAAHIRHTPVFHANPADFGVSAGSLAFKLEFMQHSGSFKARGAFASLTGQPVPKAGVVAASGGNHGAAVAYAARALGHRATIFVPAITSPAKAERIRALGAELIIGGERYQDALAASEAFAEKTGARQIHAFDQPETLLGQGTLGAEIAEDLPGIDTLLVATGGGGLIGGIAAWFESRVKLVSVEPVLAPTLHDALAAGAPVDAPAGGIAADSLAPKRVGDLMFPIASRHVAKAVLVPDEAIRAAQITLWDKLRLVAEPGGAAAMAALLSGAYKPAAGERVCVLLCGANTNAVQFG
ncbi:MAG: threonine/serine dehydratase [Proteobacteria bacterium]|nr:threonine/serine dehydratase [Pseudomonadota bacterium]